MSLVLGLIWDIYFKSSEQEWREVIKAQLLSNTRPKSYSVARALFVMALFLKFGFKLMILKIIIRL